MPAKCDLNLLAAALEPHAAQADFKNYGEAMAKRPANPRQIVALRFGVSPKTVPKQRLFRLPQSHNLTQTVFGAGGVVRGRGKLTYRF